MLMLAMALYFILLAKKRPAMVQYAALPLAFSYLIRPTNSVSIGILTLYVLIEHRRYFLPYLGWAALIAVPFFLFNLKVYEQLFSNYYGLTPDNQSDRWGTSRLLEALVGNLVSPSRGLFTFSPVLLFFLYGIYVKVRSGTFERLDYCVLAIMTLNWVMISPFPYWWGGHSYGSRYLSDLTPYLIYFLIPAVGALFQTKYLPSSRPAIPARIALAAVFTVFVAAGFVIHYRGANSFETVLWNVEPNNIDQNPGRIWDLGDIQFLRGIDD
jgi:hypothetical protein